MSLPTQKVLQENYPGASIPSQEDVQFWEATQYIDFVPTTSPTAVPLKAKVFRNNSSKELVLLMTGFNEPMLKYFEFVRELFTAGFSVCLFDHRGQSLSARERSLPKDQSQVAYVEDFSSLVEDAIDFAIHAKQLCDAQTVHMIAHSMGGLIGTYVLAKAQDLFNGQVILSCPMIETYWGDKPPGVPRQVAHALGALGSWLGQGQKLPPIPGAKLSWWDPHKPIVGVNLTHSPGRLSYCHALRSLNPMVAMLGVSMGWTKAMTRAQANVKNIAHSITNPTLLLTAEHDTLVKPEGHALLGQVVPNICRVFVHDSYHEPLFELETIRAPTVQACLAWLKRDSEFEFNLKYPLVLSDRFPSADEGPTCSCTKHIIMGVALALSVYGVVSYRKR